MGQFTFIDLFAGIGGFRLALESTGGRCAGFSEINKDAINTYCANFNTGIHENMGDIRRISNLPHHDLLTAGVPCQSWSIAGKNLGFDDDRGQLWNDTLYLLNKARPKAFIFENVKGLADPRNKEALGYIMGRISEAGYHARAHLLNARDYGVLQHRVRVYIVGFKDARHAAKFHIPRPSRRKKTLADILGEETRMTGKTMNTEKPRWSLSCGKNGINDYFLLNDIRNGETTIHSWDIADTTDRQKKICMYLLGNRRKRKYGSFDGNPLSLKHLQEIDPAITQSEIDSLTEAEILKEEDYLFEIMSAITTEMPEEYAVVRTLAESGTVNIDDIKNCRELKMRNVNAVRLADEMCRCGVMRRSEIRYDFKNSKISTGISGVSRVFLPSSSTYPTLVASDTSDFVTTVRITADTTDEYRRKFIEEIYKKGNYRKITREEACRLQGFPENYVLPGSRARWMKLIGNSVAVPVIKTIAQAIKDTGAFENSMSTQQAHTAQPTEWYKQKTV